MNKIKNAGENTKKIRSRQKALPSYTRGEEIFNMVTHIAGGALGAAALAACVITASLNDNVWGIVSGSVYGSTVILLFTVSSVYHGLRAERPKRVFQIIDHCVIYVLIAGTYTPMLLNRYREIYPADAWVIFSVIWGLAILGIVLNAVDMHRFNVLSMICYLGMGWMAAFRFSRLAEVLGSTFIFLLVAGGVMYTAGVIFYIAGEKKKYMHSVFHLFVNAGSVLHSIAIAVYIMPY